MLSGVIYKRLRWAGVFTLSLGSTLLLSFFIAAQAQDLTSAAASNPPAEAKNADTLSAADAVKLFARHCSECHDGPEPSGELVLLFEDDHKLLQRISADKGILSRVIDQLSFGTMPPEYAENALGDADRQSLIRWAEREIRATNGERDPGPFQLRRLNNREYANSIRDLLYLPADWNAAADFPADERGDGFDNNSETLIVSPLLVERWLAAAETSVNKALNLEGPDTRRDPTLPSKSKLNEPGGSGRNLDFASRQLNVRKNIEVFAPRAFRRPVSQDEIDGIMRFAALSFTHDGESFDKATALAIRATLMSPEFLFRIERDPNPDGTAKVFQVTEFQLATRMSYFLWSSMPDEELYNCAKSGTLRRDLESQVTRMLNDAKAVSLTKDFLGQWLEIRALEETPNCSPELLAAMKGETEHFFDYIVREDRSIMDFLDADYTFVNETLAKHYGIPGVSGDEFQHFAVDPAQRGGIITQASFLTLTSKPLGTSRRTSPVNRGKWILENIFNQRIPPPPPDVPALAIDNGEELKGTVRQILEQHRVDPQCAGCHARMDPYGFALENYDGFGAWRTLDNDADVDASGEISGKAYTNPREFRTILAARRDDFRRSLVHKLLAYALGRTVQGYDRQAVDEICIAVESDGDRFSSVIINIVKCYPFQHARGAGRAEASDTPSLHELTVPDAVDR